MEADLAFANSPPPFSTRADNYHVTVASGIRDEIMRLQVNDPDAQDGQHFEIGIYHPFPHNSLFFYPGTLTQGSPVDEN